MHALQTPITFTAKLDALVFRSGVKLWPCEGYE